MKKYFLALSMLLVIMSCSNDTNDQNNTAKTISSITFIGEQVIPDGTKFGSTLVGGLSSIDYSNGNFYLISDDTKAPIRVYKASLTYNASVFSEVKITDQIELLDDNGGAFSTPVDPESIRVSGNSIIWTSEGNINQNIDPFVREATITGKYVREFEIPSIFEAKTATEVGPRQNGVFESLSVSYNQQGYWVGMELPLKEDGEEPVFSRDTDSPVRISYINKATGKFEKQFAYELDKVTREIIGTGFNFVVNGLVEILEYDTNKFLALERSFTTGADDGGNNVKIYKVDASTATDISSIESLKGKNYNKVTKTLLFDFETIRDKLSSIPGGNGKQIVDNIEGITFGPKLENGNLSLVVVADNNFSAFGQQLNQFIVFEVLP